MPNSLYFKDPLQKQMAETLLQYAMIDPGEKVLVGVSAGPDSVTLAHALKSISQVFGFSIAIAHFDHNQRPETAADEAKSVADLAGMLGVDFHFGKNETQLHNGSIEEQLRTRRYAFLRQLADVNGFDKIAVGHHADDNAEAVLINLLRGSGIQGLSGIAPVRENLIVRPLINIRRSDIIAYLGRHKIAHMNDPTNDDWRYLRNKIRHHLIPILVSEYNPNIVEIINRTATLCREEEYQLKKDLAPLLTGIVQKMETGNLTLAATALSKNPKPVQRRLLRLAIEQWQGHLRRLGAAHIEAILDLSAEGRPDRQLHLPGGIMALYVNGQLQINHTGNLRQQTTAASPGQYRYIIPSAARLPHMLHIVEAGCTLRFEPTTNPGMKSLKASKPNEIFADMDALRFPLTVRNRLPGDHITPFGMQGTQSIKRLFIDRKLPRAQRQSMPLLFSGDEILWAVGMRRGSAAAVTARTTSILRVSVTQAPLDKCCEKDQRALC